LVSFEQILREKRRRNKEVVFSNFHSNFFGPFIHLSSFFLGILLISLKKVLVKNLG
jgi:hypothetical protein